MTALPSPAEFTELAPGWTAHKKAVFLDHLPQHGNARDRLRPCSVRTLGTFDAPNAEFTRDTARCANWV